MFNQLKKFFTGRNRRIPQARSFKAAMPTRMTSWLNQAHSKINWDLQSDLNTLIQRSRCLAQNNPIFRSYLDEAETNIIGAGITLQSLVKKGADLDAQLNELVENEWYQYGQKANGWITADGQMSATDFDRLVLRTFLVDGQAFIRIHRPSSNPYGITFQLIDSLSIDTTKRRQKAPGQNLIICGVQADEFYRPLHYYIRTGNSSSYAAGQLQKVPASQIIHIYRKQFANQLRGFPAICSSIDLFKNIQDYSASELMTAKVQSCVGWFYQPTGESDTGDFLDVSSAGTDGQFLQQMSPGIASIVPKGYRLNSPTVQHPNTNFAGFQKAIVQQIAASLGVGYNRLLHNYSDVNYSSLREATLDQNALWAKLQEFFLSNWKALEFRLFITEFGLNSETITPTETKKILQNFKFIFPRRAYFDAAKEIIADQRKLKLGLDNPLDILQASGKDPDQVLRGWSQWQKMCKGYGLDFSTEETLGQDAVYDFNDEANNVQN